ncbi:MAG: N-acetyltransferase [Nocardiopsaceae bacterium]|jgi:hypothetical protein|nr:N-acetyltransferase [Nocardiopsaceae bacterium]
MTAESFVSPDFAVPDGLVTKNFRLEPLGPQHNEADYAAWTSSMDHIAATPGFPDGSWPHEMSVDENRRDLERHASDYAERRGFTYTVLSQDAGDVIGCVYIYPQRSQGPDRRLLLQGHAKVSSWVRADLADLDPVLYEAVRAWLESDWPFTSIDYAPRGSTPASS